jgi:AcrR family transcriptional regulator
MLNTWRYVNRKWPLARERRTQLTRDHLLASAERLFIERGFHAASIDDIAQAAGFTKGAVYPHFWNKEEVSIALTERRWDERLARVRTALDTLATSSADQRSASFVDLTRNLLWDDPDWSLLVLEFNVYAARNPSAQHRLKGCPVCRRREHWSLRHFGHAAGDSRTHLLGRRPSQDHTPSL